ncbi:hypothetical protein [Microbacterium testaceum]|nr:hypothetical protein [Microbacterium testaceum]
MAPVAAWGVVDRERALGWTASISLEEGMERTVAWYRDHVDTIRE